MRVSGAIVAAICTIGLVMPAHAIGMKVCDDIKDDQSRMDCLQEHITQLEQTIVALGGEVAALQLQLDLKLSADLTYKLRSVTQGKCLSSGGDDHASMLATCDNPDSWALLAGAPIQKPKKPEAATSNPGSSAPNSEKPPAAASASAPNAPPANPCRGLDQVGCTAKSASCTWKADKSKCRRKDNASATPPTPE